MQSTEAVEKVLEPSNRWQTVTFFEDFWSKCEAGWWRPAKRLLVLDSSMAAAGTVVVNLKTADGSGRSFNSVKKLCWFPQSTFKWWHDDVLTISWWSHEKADERSSIVCVSALPSAVIAAPASLGSVAPIYYILLISTKNLAASKHKSHLSPISPTTPWFSLLTI